MMLSVKHEMSMAGYEKFRNMNGTTCRVKETHDNNWGGICVLAADDLY